MAKVNISDMTVRFKSVGGSVYMLVPPVVASIIPKEWINGKEKDVIVDVSENNDITFFVHGDTREVKKP